MLSKFWSYLIPLSLGWFWLEMKGFGVVHVFRTNCYLFTLKPHFCILLFVVHLDRHMTRNRVSLVNSVHYVLDVGVIIVLSWLFLGRAGDRGHKPGGNFWSYLCLNWWVYHSHDLLLNWFTYTFDLWLEWLWFLFILYETRVYFIILVLLPVWLITV